MTPDPTTPSEALAAVRRSREAVLERLDFPIWHNVVTAACAGAMIAGHVLPGDWPTLVTLTCIIVLALLYRAWSQRTGLSITGFGPGRARWVGLGLAAVILVLFLVSYRLKYDAGVWWAPAPAGLLAALAAYTASLLWRRVQRAELRDRT